MKIVCPVKIQMYTKCPNPFEGLLLTTSPTIPFVVDNVVEFVVVFPFMSVSQLSSKHFLRLPKWTLCGRTMSDVEDTIVEFRWLNWMSSSFLSIPSEEKEWLDVLISLTLYTGWYDCRAEAAEFGDLADEINADFMLQNSQDLKLLWHCLQLDSATGDFGDEFVGIKMSSVSFNKGKSCRLLG